MSAHGRNAVHLMVRGYVLTHTINGQVMSIVMDNDVEGRKAASRCTSLRQ